METALLLGLTSGGACLGTCGPLLAAFLAAERSTLKRSAALLTVFLSGRLLGYSAWGVLSWLLGMAMMQSSGVPTAFAAADLVLGAWLLYFGISQPIGHSQVTCPGSIFKCSDPSSSSHQVFFRGATWGFLGGLQICPPFLAAVTHAARAGSLGGSLLFFFLFYVGTGLWFIPFPFIGTLGRFRQVAQVARFCALPLGAFYFYSGLISMAGGNPFHG
jgi:sulfite exporter TauE/SafE